MENLRRGNTALLDATGTIRRLEAMQRLGFGPTAVGRALGMSRGNILRIRYTQKSVSRDMAARVDELYRQVSAMPVTGKRTWPQRVTRTKAAMAGMAPPMAWDDIDTDKGPSGMDTRRVNRHKPKRLTRDERLEEIIFLKNGGMTDLQVGERLGMKLESVQMALWRSRREAAA